MSESLTEDEVRRRKIAAMGDELGELAFLLWKDVTWLHFEWREFRELFGVDGSRIDLMNKTAPRFFWALERVLWQDTLLGLARLMDGPGTGGQQNVTLRRLPKLVAPAVLPALNSELDRCDRAVAFARDWRHRRYAHRDLSHAADAAGNPLKHASRQAVEDALDAIRGVMNVLESHYEDSSVMYNVGGPSLGGAYELLLHLDAGLEAEERRERELDVSWRPRFR